MSYHICARLAAGIEVAHRFPTQSLIHSDLGGPGAFLIKEILSPHAAGFRAIGYAIVLCIAVVNLLALIATLPLVWMAFKDRGNDEKI